MKITYIGPHREVALEVDGRRRTVERHQTIQVSSDAGKKLVRQQYWIDGVTKKAEGSDEDQAQEGGDPTAEVTPDGS